MGNKSKMRVTIVLQFLAIIMLHSVKGDIRDFIVSDETDLKRFPVDEAEMMDEMDVFDYDNDMDMYESCSGGIYADDPMYSYEEQNDFSIASDDMDSTMKMHRIIEVYRKLATDPRYSALLEKIKGLQEQYSTPSCV